MQKNLKSKIEQNELLEYVENKANEWLEGNYDDVTKNDVRSLLNKSDKTELINSFYRDLEFGTGGLRGIMGVGTNRMNKYTVGKATQGLANYLLSLNIKNKIKVAIAYDCRNNSKEYAHITAEVLASNDIEVHLFEDMRPVPELSFAVRRYKCNCGIVITASHNAPKYNGYKVFWDDGGQIIPPHDKNIIEETKKITNVDQIKFNRKPNHLDTKKNNFKYIGSEIDNYFLDEIYKLRLSEDSIKNQHDLKIVYTPLHGTGIKLIPNILKRFGFTNVNLVVEQSNIDGNFENVHDHYPNPEEPKVFDLAIKTAKKIDAEVIIATDPDADRAGVAIKKRYNEYEILNGNQSATLLTYYILTRWYEKQKLKGQEYIVKTIVTSELLRVIADSFGVECLDVLTGFKWIAKRIRQNERNKTFICGGEESIGFIVGDFVRDKDAVTTSAMVAEMAAWTADNDKSLHDLLIDIYLKFGLYKSRLVYIVRDGLEGETMIRKMMKDYRSNPPKSINNSLLVKINDYLILEGKDIVKNETYKIDMENADVMQFYLEDNCKITVRPSGTEPKIKYYIEVQGILHNRSDFENINNLLNQKIDNIVRSMGLE